MVTWWQQQCRSCSVSFISSFEVSVFNPEWQIKQKLMCLLLPTVPFYSYRGKGGNVNPYRIPRGRSFWGKNQRPFPLLCWRGEKGEGLCRAPAPAPSGWGSWAQAPVVEAHRKCLAWGQSPALVTRTLLAPAAFAAGLALSLAPGLVMTRQDALQVFEHLCLSGMGDWKMG